MSMRPSPEPTVTLDALSTRLESLRLRTPASIRHLAASLARDGQLTPIVTCATADGLEVVDGFKRVRAARELGLERLRIWTAFTDAKRAKASMLTLNAVRGLDEIEEAWLVRSLYREDKLSQPEIGVLLGRHKSWVCRRLALAQGLVSELEIDVRHGLLGASAARELARLPRGNQRPVADEVARRGMTAHQTAHLVQALVAIPAEAQLARLAELIAEHAARARPQPRPRAPTLGEAIVTDAGAVTRIAARLQSRLHERPLSTLGDAEQAVAEALVGLRSVLIALARTIARVTKEHHHDEP